MQPFMSKNSGVLMIFFKQRRDILGLLNLWVVAGGYSSVYSR
jgi:hypothetical protein